MEKYININEAASHFRLAPKELHKLLYDKEKKLEITLLEFDPSQNSYGSLVISRYLFDEMKRLYDVYSDKITPIEEIRLKKGMTLSIMRSSYVYFLFDGNSLVYIGQTVNLNGRIGEHIKTKKFDSVYWEEFKEHELSIMEAMYINIYGGKYNIVKYKDTIEIVKKIIEKIDLFEY